MKQSKRLENSEIKQSQCSVLSSVSVVNLSAEGLKQRS